MKISVSYLSSILSKEETIKSIDNSTADFIHVDLMDGIFVPKNNMKIKEVINDLKNTKKPLDIHLMTVKPSTLIDELSILKPEYITFHIEIDENIDSLIKKLKDLNIKVGISIKPNTEIKVVEKYLNDIDMILVMTVEPGAGGQRFMFEILDKISELNNIRKNNNYKYLINVDGGINEYTALRALKSGADVLVSGSYICKSTDYNEKINTLKK